MNDSRTEHLFLNYIKILKIYLLFLVVMSSFRVFFVGYFGDFSELASYRQDLLYSFFMGWKYDTLVISYIIAPVLVCIQLTSLVKMKFIKSAQNLLSFFYFSLLSLLVPFILICDLGFYSFFQDHINILFFGFIEDDTVALLSTIWKNYPVVPGLVAFAIYWLVFLTFLGKVLRRKKTFFRFKGSFPAYCFLSLVMMVLVFGGARGGYGALVLAPKYSDFSESEFVNQIALNGVIALEKTIQLRRTKNNDNYNMLAAMGYKKGIHDAYTDYLGFDVSGTKRELLINLLKRKTAVNPQYEKQKRNVVVIVMESFGSNWIQYNEESFNFMGDLKKHFAEDYFFENFISSENGTIGSLMTLLTNTPPRPGKRFLSESKYMRLPLESSSNIPYQRAGYEAFFVYGGKLGWRDIGKYARIQGYDHSVGESGIRKKLKLKGQRGTEWGLYDEHFFDYILKELEGSSRPKFFVGLSTSNHPPFDYPSDFVMPEINIPAKLEGRITREEQLFIERFKAFSYANYSLAKFLDKIKNSQLAENTIVAVTGDHNFWGFMNYNKEEVFKKYTVPLYLYFPNSKNKNKDEYLKKIGSHEDIMTTLYNLSLSGQEYLSFGEDLLSESESIGINSSLLAGKRGVTYKGKNFFWSEQRNVMTKSTNEKFESLDQRYRSTMSIVDKFLEDSLKNYNKSN